MPGRLPIIIGCCFSFASAKKPTTQVPSTRKDGVDFDVKLTNYYFQTLAQMKLICHDMFEDGLSPGVWK